MYRHLTMAELLELRDGEGKVAARQHLDTCEACAFEFELIHQRVAALRALPALQPPRDRWEVVRQQHVAGRRRGAWRAAGIMGMAAAAMLAVFVGVRSFTTDAVRDEAEVQQALAQWMEESRRLESLLHAVDREPRVMTGMTAATIADLEDRIAFVDEGIARATAARYAPDQVGALWRERVALMGTLVNTHVRNVAYVGY